MCAAIPGSFIQAERVRNDTPNFMWTIFLKLISVFLMLFFGFLARRRKLINANSTRDLAALATNLIYPCLIYTSIVRGFSFEELWSNRVLPIGGFLLMAGGFVIGLVCLKVFKFRDVRRQDTMLFQCSINNYSFLPMPLVFALAGDRGVALLIFSTVGSELAVWTLGIYALNGRKLSIRELRHLASMPMLAIAAAFATLLGQAVLEQTGLGAAILAPWLCEAANSLVDGMALFGKGTIPVAMIMTGSRAAGLHPHHLFCRDSFLVVGLRLLLIPALAALLLLMLNIDPEQRLILLVVATMPSAISSVLLTELYESDADFAASTVVLTHVVCLATVPFWLGFCQALGR